ncbi:MULTISPECIES: tRNA (adenosine(37)-N6)-threonylcarbamoyltransferase complex dimerization subunit type 1 TsaB [Acidiphilium]|uniref:tRNA (Adenosine(37)-N6)-threonylcarbamoyltransferase complex dimerization subunit type 1 TsaB n=1 Tax=Acidiphilium iwatense TaxID=768198 RepID=A0ABS9DYP0_9PROT|nr:MULTISPECIES: tRNA (adenosine(37)-N6)-threonylcarbamoyltransferase complex dimerization subunit type 1 TsaB [Acidiphilium]MCF3947872.1 tRNA (adenosine(37)-N6)-threonylcarbamoyltransferase complex dimerization subunit type 1 TsaB [Acidiphilium iwatense]
MSEKPPGRILAIDAAQRRASVTLMEGDHVRALRAGVLKTGLADTLAVWVDDCLAEAGIAASALDAIAVTVGPGSFTGLRAAIALAQGLGVAAGVPVHGISMSEAFGAAFPTLHRPLWIAIAARRGRLFLVRDGRAAAFDDADIPVPDGPVALAGDRAGETAAMLAARGHDVMLTDARFCSGAAIASALRHLVAGGDAPRPAAPLYVDPPEAKLPEAGLRPPPQ